MTDAPSRIDIAELRARLPIEALCGAAKVQLRKVGAWLVGLCPFHEEQTPSFQVGSERPDRWACRGCGEQGDAVDFWMKWRGIGKGEAIRELAGMCGLSAPTPGVPAPCRKVSRVTRASKERKKPPLPRMRGLRDGEIEALAALLGLSVAGVTAAARTFHRVGFCEWPQWLGRDGEWRPGRGMGPSWVVTDDERWCAQFRKLDGSRYPATREGEGGARVVLPEEEWPKALTKGSPSWPIGAAALGERRRVLWCEGGSDLIAAYHFLNGFGLLGSVGVVGMLGVHNRIAEEALPLFAGCRVRMMMDQDKVKEQKIKGGDGQVKRTRLTRAGHDGCLRWQEQLTAAGAVTETFSLEGLTRVDGRPVEDLRDLAMCSAAVVGSEEVMEAFYEWDF